MSMKRSEFLKRLGIGMIAIPMGPKILAEIKEMKLPQVEEKLPLPDDYVEIGKPDIHDEMLRKFGHHEEPWIHDYGWPYRMNDIVLTVDEKQYLVTQVWEDRVVCTPLIDGPEITLTKDGDEKALIILNIKSQL
jgi:hypothetical protein